ncbi:MAG: ATP-binding protein, partial [Lysobacterales bacterium]
MKEYKSPPRASSLIESMRDIGYSFETAIADIIDNSITAKASLVDIFCDADRHQPVIGILDNGFGMSRDELLDAMRPGSQSPLEIRRDGDLGRFGLGMKIASFSQCRRLTVITKKSSVVAATRWDLDYVATKDEWLLQILDEDECAATPFFQELGDSGTLVVWENLDRLCDETQKTSRKDHLYEQLDHVRNHLELVFHRFLAGERPFPKLALRINRTEIDAFDPFNSGHPATIIQPEEKIFVAGAPVLVKSFVLPHHKKASKADWERYAGDGGYIKNQGFYVYR